MDSISNENKKINEVYKELGTYRTILEYSSNLVSKHSPNGIFHYISPASKSLLGYPTSQLIDESIFDYCHPEDQERVEESFLSLKPKKLVFRMLRNAGDYIWLEATLDIIKLDGQENEILCVSRDVTDRMTEERETRESREKYRLLVEYIQDTIGFITNDGVWIYINDAGKKLLGLTDISEIIGQSLLNFIHPDDHEEVKERFKQILEGEKPSAQEPLEVKILRHDKHIKHVRIILIPSEYKGRETQQIIIRDLTEHKQTEEILHQTEKLSVVGHLAAGIAHEIRNPLTSIKGFTQLLRKNVTNEKYIDVMLSELDRIENIVGDLLVMAKPQIENTSLVDLKHLIKDATTLLNSQVIMQNLVIVTNYPDDEILVEGDPNKLKQVLINVLGNAIESMKEGTITVNLLLKEVDEACIEIIDQGIGIPENRLKKIGEPFYSTKEKGTGLGLMICHKIIKGHKGKLKIYSEVDKGTTVEIILPAYK